MCIRVSSSELSDFGVVYDPTQSEKDDGAEDGKVARNPRNKKKKRRRGGRRQKLKFEVEETRDNQVLCDAVHTVNADLSKYGRKQKHKKKGQFGQNWWKEEKDEDSETDHVDAFLLGGARLSGYCRLSPVKEQTRTSHWMETSKTRKAMIRWVKTQNESRVIEWRSTKKFVESKGFGILSEVVCPQQYADYVKVRSMFISISIYSIPINEPSRSVSAKERVKNDGKE